MRILNIWILCILILISSCLYAQEVVYIGMTADEFKTKLPGILPDTVIFNGDLYLHENLDRIAGKWTFCFYGNMLGTADFQGESKIKSEDDFNKWVESAKSIIKVYTSRHGQPVK